MNKKRREEEAEILKKMLSDDGAEEKSDSPSSSDGNTKKSFFSSTDTEEVIRCPRCGYVLSSRTLCPRCGYNGYIPMTKAQTRKIKLILYPIVLVLVILFILWKRGIFG